MDEWIDRAVRAYVPAEAPPGIERRILAHARAPRRSFAPWLAAAAVVCAVCAAMVLRPLISAPATMPVNMRQALLPAAPVIEAQSLPQYAAVRRKARPRVLPKLRVFPEIERVPEAEVELARLALNPKVGKALLAQPEMTEPEPIRIEPLSIKLLDED
jgi:hypothetical protein